MLGHAAFSSPHGLCAMGHILASGCSYVKQKPAAWQLPLGIRDKCAQKSPLCPISVLKIKAMPLPKSAIYLLLIRHFFFFLSLAEDPLSKLFKGHF